MGFARLRLGEIVRFVQAAGDDVGLRGLDMDYLTAADVHDIRRFLGLQQHIVGERPHLGQFEVGDVDLARHFAVRRKHAGRHEPFDISQFA
ncbi:MAG: hypothetical protein ACD_75C01034G0001 [uncultured bacterium]|nr:MAG: hypothetical protein ACD_75C01034G0001 [uncultured bacterium]